MTTELASAWADLFCATMCRPKMKRHLGLVAVYSFSVVLAFELAGRVNFFSHHDLSFWTPASHLAYRFYPNLKPIMEDNHLDRIRVLVLAASALNPGWSDFEVRLRDQLSTMLGREVQVFNSSMPARTSLDSYYKYWFLRKKHFDLVILYNSINELRANNVPDALWRDDYSHYAWYDEANFYFRHYNLARYGTILPFYLKHLAVVLDRKVLHRGQKVPYNAERTRPDWWRFGDTVKSEKSFRHNLEGTIALARAKHEPVLVMTYAYYLPPNYSLERFEKGQLDYAQSTVKGSPVEIWGLPANVQKGLDVHNNVLQEFAKTDGVFFVDQQALLGDSAKNFIDVCHLSPAGMEQFVRNLVVELLKRRWGTQLSVESSLQPAPGQGPRSRTTRERTGTFPSGFSPVIPDAAQPSLISPAGERHPFAFGSQIVWQGFHDRRRSGIYVYDLTTERGEQVLESTGPDEVFPRIAGYRIISDVIARQGRREIYVYDERTKQKQRLTGKHAIGMSPDISGDLAVWSGLRDARAAGYDIFLYDFTTKKEIHVTNDPGYDDGAPAIDQNRIVWQSLRAGQSGIYLCTYDRATGTCPEHRIIADDGGRTFVLGEPDIAGSLIVFSKVTVATHAQTIYLYDLIRDRIQLLSTRPGFQQSPKISGSQIVWQDQRSGVWDVYYCEYDPRTGTCPEAQVTHDPWTEWQLSLSDNRIFWEDYRSGHPILYMYEMRQ